MFYEDLNPKEISGRILEITEHHNMNQQAFAAFLKISQPAVSNYLKGRIPPPDVLLKISSLGGRSIEWILTGQEQNFSSSVRETDIPYEPDHELLKLIRQLPKNSRDKLIDFIKSIK